MRLIHAKRVTVLAVVAVAVSLFGAQRARAREANLLEVLTGFSSKEACSCVFLAEQSDDYCSAYGQSAGLPPTVVVIDHANKRVTSSLGAVSRTARFTEGEGCVKDPLP